MNELEQASTLIGDIYDAALDPALWGSVLEQTCQFVYGCNAGLLARVRAEISMRRNAMETELLKGVRDLETLKAEALTKRRSAT